MENNLYQLADPSKIHSPALLYYPDIIVENIQKAISIAGNAQRLWPHVKTHKLPQIIALQQAAGIERFKCATIAEAEMLAQSGARHILFAYPLVGPNITRLITIMKNFPHSEWWVIGDSADALAELNHQADSVNLYPNLLIDVNMGMNRTGVLPSQLEQFYHSQAQHKNLRLRGLHCYDGHINEPDPLLRKKFTEAATQPIVQICESLLKHGHSLDTLVMGGTPTFPCHAVSTFLCHATSTLPYHATPSLPYHAVPTLPCHAARSETHLPPGIYTFLSPGTLFINDHGYASRYADLPFTPAATLFTRVVSHPAPGLFTLDLGSKAIGADPANPRGIITTLPHATPVSHSEEHWTFNKNEGLLPPIGEALHVIPTHICTTAALYDEAQVVRNGQIIDNWKIIARKRRIST